MTSCAFCDIVAGRIPATIVAAYPFLTDDTFVAEHLDGWLDR